MIPLQRFQRILDFQQDILDPPPLGHRIVRPLHIVEGIHEPQ
jgi:hypothetical protein